MRTALAIFLLAAAAAVPVTAGAAPVLIVDFETAPRAVEYELYRMVTIHPGDEYSTGELDRNRRLLTATGLFRTVEVDAVEIPGGWRVLFSVVPYELVEKVRLTGNFLMLRKNLVRILRVKVGDPFREDVAREDALALMRIYEEDGYSGTTVQTEIDHGRKGVRVTYDVNEGKPGVIRKIEFSGNSSIPTPELTSQLKMTLFTFFRRETLQESIDRVERYYRERGFLDVSATARTVRGKGVVPPAFTLTNPVKGLISALPGQYEVVDIFFDIEEGPQYSVEIDGNEAYTDEDLLDRMTFFETGFFDEHEAEESRKAILAFYLERGFYRAEVTLDLDREQGMVRFTVTEGDRYELSSLELVGVEFFTEQELLSSLESWRGDVGGRPLREELLGKDRAAIKGLYRFEGFVDAEVLPPIVRLDDPPGGAAVVFSVREGARSIVRKVTFVGVTSVGEEELREVVKSREDLPFRAAWVVRDKEAILRLVSSKGYPRVRVREEISFSDARDQVVVHFIVEEGERHDLGTVLVVGNRKTKNKVIRRELPIKGGDPFNIDALAAGKRNLYGLGYFDEVRLKVPELVEEKTSQDVVVRVRERPTGLLKFGGGYGSWERFRGFVEVGERNLFGTGRDISLRAKVSTRGRRYDLFYRERWPFGYRINSEANVFEEFREEKAYDVISRGVNIGVKKKFRGRYTINLKYRLDFVEYANVTFEFDDPLEAAQEEEDLEPINISSGIAIFGLDLRDNPVAPHRGTFHIAGVEVATPFLGGDTAFNKYTFETHWYLPATDRSTLAFGFRGGFAQTLTGFETLPLSERFFLGGARGVRGWAEDEVGPKDDAGNPIGGDAYALGIAEFRFPLGRKNWGGVLFFDVGNVWTTLTDIAPTKAKYGVGAGIRYNTLVGPLRLDYGIKLNPDEGESPGRIYFNIGFPI